MQAIQEFRTEIVLKMCVLLWADKHVRSGQISVKAQFFYRPINDTVLTLRIKRSGGQSAQIITFEVSNQFNYNFFFNTYLETLKGTLSRKTDFTTDEMKLKCLSKAQSEFWGTGYSLVLISYKLSLVRTWKALRFFAMPSQSLINNTGSLVVLFKQCRLCS